MDSRDKTGPIQLTVQQQKAAVELAEGLQDDSHVSCSNLLRNLLLSLYAPKDTSIHASNIFSSPVVAFLALECKTEEGAYHEISRIGRNAAMIQTCIRIRCLGYLACELRKTVIDNWIEYVIPLTLIYCTNL